MLILKYSLQRAHRSCLFGQKTPIRVRQEKRELPEAFGDSQEEKDTVRTVIP